MPSPNDLRPGHVIPPTNAPPAPPQGHPSIPSDEEAADDGYDRAWITRRLRQRAILDRLLAGLVVVLAFVLASVPVRNSDLWAHLASGRHVCQYPLGTATDPFTHTAADPGAASPSWLFDVGCYGLYSAAGGFALGLAHALAVALLAAVLLRAGRQGGGWLLPAVVTACAMLAIAPRLQLQPMLVSVMFLALTIWFLEQRRLPQCRALAPRVHAATASDETTDRRAGGWRAYWPLWALFVVWVNTDGWFVLGPLVLACYALAGVVSTVPRARVPGVAVVAGLAVCLLNPQLHGAFRLPAELAFPARYPALAGDSLFGGLFLSPLQRAYYQPEQGWNIAGLAAGLLALAGILAFAANRSRPQLPRLLLCMALAGLALYQARNLPFLMAALAMLVPRAVRWTPAARFGGAPGAALRLRQGVTGRVGAAIAGAALIGTAFLGQIQPGVAQARGWNVEIDPSLVRAAEDLAAWRRAGKLDERSLGFNFSPEVANYAAWFGAGEKGFFDGRLNQSGPAAVDFATVRLGLSATPRPGDDGAQRESWRAVLRRRKVNYLILADRDRARMRAALRTVLADPAEWANLFQSGRVLVLGWRDPAAQPPARASWTATDLNYLGLHPSEAEKAPREGPAAASPPAPGWAVLAAPAVPPSLGRDEAQLGLMIFDALKLHVLQANLHHWETAQAAAAVGALLPGDPLGMLTTAALRVDWLAANAEMRLGKTRPALAWTVDAQIGFLRHRDSGPPGYLWAAVRACRRAVAADPRDAEAYLLLGEAYFRIATGTPEQTWAALPLIGQLRMQLAVDALQHAVQLQPDLEQGHVTLATLYQRLGFLDLTQRHLQAHVKLLQDRGPRVSEPAEVFAADLARRRTAVEQLEQEIARRHKEYEGRQASAGVASRAQMLQQVGLAGRALDVLLRSDMAAFGAAGTAAEFELLLSSGRAADARAWLGPEHRDALGGFNYDWLGVRLAVLAGDYDDADAKLEPMLARAVTVQELGPRPVDLETGIAVTVGSGVLAGAVDVMAPPTFLRLYVPGSDPQVRLQAMLPRLQQTAGFLVLRGCIAFERGDVDRAERSFRAAMDLTGADAKAPVAPGAGAGLLTITRYYIELLDAPPRRW